MTSIKPPAPGPTSTHPRTDASTSNPAGPSTTTSESTSAAGAFKAAVEAGDASRGASAASHISSQTGTDPLTVLVREVELGRLNMEQAVEQLLQHTVSSVGAQLSAAERAELADLLRSALANDPTLRALSDSG